MAFWGLENFVFGNVSGAFTTGQLTLNMAVGHTARFTSFPMRAVLWEVETYANPAEAFWDGKAEIITIVSKSGDTFNSILRGQEGTSAISSDGSKVWRVAPVLTRGQADKIVRAPPDGSDGFDAIRDGTAGAVAAADALGRFVHDDGVTAHDAILSLQGGPRTGCVTELDIGDTAAVSDFRLFREIVNAGTGERRLRSIFNAIEFLSMEHNGAFGLLSSTPGTPESGPSVYIGKKLGIDSLISFQDKGPTISSGSLTVDSVIVKPDAESGTADDLDTITASHFFGMQSLLFLRYNGADAITVKDGTGNIELEWGDYILNSVRSQLVLLWDSAGDRWREITRVHDERFVLIEDLKAQNTAGGTFTSGAWQTRDLNTEYIDTNSLASIAANQVTLSAGVWHVFADAPAYLVNRHQVRLQDMTGGGAGMTIREGTSEFAPSTAAVVTRSFVFGRINSPSGGTIVELQHQCQTTRATDGFGLAANFTSEKYARFAAWRVK